MTDTDELARAVAEIELGLSSHAASVEMRDFTADLRLILTALRKQGEALEFYAEVENWHGVYMCGHGPMTEDWGGEDIDPQYPDGKPGNRARQALSPNTQAREGEG